MSNIPTNTTITNTLIELGLGQNEAKLYEILLSTPVATIPILTQKSGLSRTMLYYVLGNLESRELAATKKDGKKTVYLATPPEKLDVMMADQEKELSRQKAMLGEVMADLKGVYRLAHNQPGVRFFEGTDGIRTVTMDSLNAIGEIYTFIDAEGTDKYIKKINEDYVRRRKEKNIPKKLIATDTPFARSHYAQLNSPLTQVRLLPAGQSPFRTGMQIYNNTISYSTLDEKKMIGVIIEDENIAQMHKTLFEYIWNSLPKLPEPTTDQSPLYSMPNFDAPSPPTPPNSSPPSADASS